LNSQKSGELPSNFGKGTFILYSRNIEYNLFGELRDLVEYDMMKTHKIFSEREIYGK
jgi:hypothetical protein